MRAARTCPYPADAFHFCSLWPAAPSDSSNRSLNAHLTTQTSGRRAQSGCAFRYAQGMHAVCPTGHEYLALVTELLQRRRLADPSPGCGRRPICSGGTPAIRTRTTPTPSSGSTATPPVTAAVFTRWSASRYGCDVLGDTTLDAAWEFVHHRCAELAAASIEMEST